MILKQTTRLQKIRPGTKWESYRVCIPKSIVGELNLENAELLLEVDAKRIVISQKS